MGAGSLAEGWRVENTSLGAESVEAGGWRYRMPLVYTVTTSGVLIIDV